MPHGVARRRDDDVIETALFGDVSIVDVERMHASVLDVLAERPARAVIIDVSRMDRFTPRVREPGVPFLVMLREHGIHLVVAKGASALTRMTASAIALAANLPLKFAADDADTEAMIAAHATKQRRKNA